MDKEQCNTYSKGTPWATFREAERHARVGDGVIRAAAERGEIPAYRRKGGKGAIVNLNDVDEWIRSTWPQVKGVLA
jgi:hypothetical protein